MEGVFFSFSFFILFKVVNPKTKLIKVNEECIFLINFFFLLTFPAHTNSTELVLKIKNSVEQRKGIASLPR